MCMDNYIEVFEAYDVSQAYVVKAALENEGLTVLLENEYLQGGLGGLPLDGSAAPRLSVPTSEEQAARKVIDGIVKGGDSRQAASPVGSETFTTLMRITFDTFVRDEVLELGERAVRIFERQPGCLGLKRYQVKSSGGVSNEILLLVDWRDERAYRACQDDRDLMLLMPQWNALQEDGDVNLEIRFLTAT